MSVPPEIISVSPKTLSVPLKTTSVTPELASCAGAQAFPGRRKAVLGEKNAVLGRLEGLPGAKNDVFNRRNPFCRGRKPACNRVKDANLPPRKAARPVSLPDQARTGLAIHPLKRPRRNHKLMWEISGYLGLFLAAFGAATLLPLQSEAVLVSLLLTEHYPAWTLLAVATTGNVLGSTLNWLLGLYIERHRHKRWFPVRENQLEQAQRAYQRFGHWSLLLSWVPVIGDPLTVIAGVMREPLWRFLLLVTIAKATRYLVLAVVTLGGLP